MSVRKIKKSYISCVGYFKSLKNNRQVAFESILERDFFTILEFEDDVILYDEQPFQLNYKLNEMYTRYTPDTLVTYADDSQKVFEVKYQDEIDSDKDLQYKLSIVSHEISQQKALPFDIFTDIQLNEVYLKNCIFLYRFAFITYDEFLIGQVVSAINTFRSSISVQALLEHITLDSSQQLKIIPYIWLTIFHNTGLIDMHQKITMSTMINAGCINE